jgi:hypothetical protein
MRRLFWFALGAVVGAWAMHKFTRLTRSFTPRGVTARAVGAGARLRSYAAEIRAEMTAREAELWSMLKADALQDGAPPEPILGQAARGRHVRTAGRHPGRTPDRPPGRPPGRTPNGRVLDDDKDGH